MVPKGCPNGAGAPQRLQKILEKHKVPKKSEFLQRARPFFEDFFGPSGFFWVPWGTQNHEKSKKWVPKVDSFRDKVLDRFFHRFLTKNGQKINEK